MVGATVGLGATVVAVGVIGATDITARAARTLGARPVMTLAGTSNVQVSPLTLLLAFILTTSLCPSRGTMMLCARLSKPTARPPTSSVLQSTPPRAEKEEYSETDIFGTAYSSDTESSDHDDQKEAQALTAHDDLIAAGSVIIDMLDAEPSQQMQQERLKADEELTQAAQAAGAL
jgi:hypothetical protein